VNVALGVPVPEFYNKGLIELLYLTADFRFNPSKENFSCNEFFKINIFNAYLYNNKEAA